MDYYISIEDLDRILAALGERASREERSCEWCRETVAAVMPSDLDGRGPRFFCTRHAEWIADELARRDREADELARRDLDDVKLRGA